MRSLILMLCGAIALCGLSACGTGSDLNQWWSDQHYELKD